MKLISNYKYIILSILILSSCGESKTIGKTIDISEGIESTYYEGDYVIDKNIDLKGKSMELPDCGRVIITSRGHVSNGTLIISPNTYEIEGGWGVFSNVKLQSKTPLSNTNKCAISEINARWFCKSVGGNIDNTKSLQEAIDAAHSLYIPVYLPRGYYKITSSLSLYEGDILKGEYAGIITTGHQKGTTFIRYNGDGKSMIEVKGKYVSVSNLLLSASTPYRTNGFSIEGDAGLYFNLENVFIGNSKYGIAGTLEKNMGFSECIWQQVRIWNCVRGLSIDITSEGGQYVTYNNFYNLCISNAKEKGVYIRCRAINSCAFRDCLMETVGYAGAYDSKYSNSGIYAIEAVNEGSQGSLTIDGGYFENIYYSQSKGELVSKFNYANNAVVSVSNISLSVMNTRFANTRTVVKSNGQDVINIMNCIDNGYLGQEQSDVTICNPNPKTIIDVNGYSFANKNKDVINDASRNAIVRNPSVRNVRSKDGSIR